MILFSSGIIKNYPVFGQQALQELMQDNLIKFNYFLADVRGRRLRSYLKLPLPQKDDPLSEHIFEKLMKHDINIDEYYSIYKNSSIPSNNHFSQFGLDTFDSTSSLVGDYSKYKDQLNFIIKRRLENNTIQETEDKQFKIKNASTFRDTFNEIQNLPIETYQEKINNKSEMPNVINSSAIYQERNSMTALRNNIITTDTAMATHTFVRTRELDQQGLDEMTIHVENVQRNTRDYFRFH